MALSVACPHCKQVNRLDDSQKGKEVRCTHCQKGFLVRVRSAADAEGGKAQIKAGPPKLPSAAARRDEPALDDVDVIDDAPRPRGRRARDDQRERSSSNVSLIVGLSIGGLLLVGGGIAVGVYFMVAIPDAQPAMVVQEGPAMPVPGIAPPVAPIRLQDVVLDPTRAEDFDMMLKLLNSEEEVLRKRAYEWLARANPEHPRRAEVAKILESRVPLHVQQPHHNDPFFNAFFAWATKDNFNWLINLVREKGLGAPARRRHQAMETLARLKDDRAVPEMVQLLESFHDRDAAFKALAQMGSVAEKVVIGDLNHPDNGVRDATRRLLQLYNTSQDKLIQQSVTDLASVEDRRVDQALDFLGTMPVDEKKRSEVAKALDRHLTPDSRRNSHLMKALQRWATADNVPKIAQMIEAERLSAGELIKTLAQIKDARSAQVLANRMGNFFDGKEAQQALMGMGSLAEAAVVPHLINQDGKTRIAAANVLAVVGSPNALPALNQAGRAFMNDRNFAQAALAAIQAIQARAQQ